MVGDRRYEAYRETGLVLMTHRYYDPETGRFLTRDSIGYAGGVNLYGYVQGNPVNWVDPWGLSKDSKPRKKWRDRYNEAKAAATVALSSAGALVGHYIDKTGRGAAVGGAIGLGMGVVGGFLDYKAYKCAAEHQGRRLWGGDQNERRINRYYQGNRFSGRDGGPGHLPLPELEGEGTEGPSHDRRK